MIGIFSSGGDNGFSQASGVFLPIKGMIATDHELKSFIRDFENGTLPKPCWTHHAHLVVALWYLVHHTQDDALEIIRQRIRAYNEAVGTPNTDSRGYHETLTQLFVRGVAVYLTRHREGSLPTLIDALLKSPLGSKDWPLQFYSRERLFSVAARRSWVEPEYTHDGLKII